MALHYIEPAQWRLFERFASQFLASEFPSLRTVAGPGDKGRDAELFSPEDLPTVALQYSVAEDWKRKIRDTAQRLQKELPNTRILIFLSPQSIGTSGDGLKSEVLRENGLSLDIRDRNWFLDRHSQDLAKNAASQELAISILDPILQEKNLISAGGLALNETEARSALLLLSLEWKDHDTDKGLTKVALEAIVLSILRETNSENRMSRQEILESAQRVLASHEKERIRALINGSLKRLTKRKIRHWKSEDEFCLTYEESIDVKSKMAKGAALDIEVDNEIRSRVLARLPQLDSTILEWIGSKTRLLLELVLWEQGETFAEAVQHGKMVTSNKALINKVKTEMISAEKLPAYIEASHIDLIEEVVLDTIIDPTKPVQERLRNLADSYTIFAFLRETPDVQKVVSKLFSGGTIWLDTSVLLPLIAEDILDEEDRRFGKTIAIAQDAGVQLRVTSGVLEELNSHMKKSLSFTRTNINDWHGRQPFLAVFFANSGKPLNGFASWLERFRGNNHPEDDLADFLKRFYKIEVEDLEAEVNQAPSEIRFAVQNIWREAHKRRRSEWDSMLLDRLVRHDVENYVGVLQRRKKTRRSNLGFREWWLTLDSVAFRVHQELRQQISATPSTSPVMSVDFLVSYLAVGPMRRKISKSAESVLPLSAEANLLSYYSSAIITAAGSAREKSAALADHVIDRQLRDRLDEVRGRVGAVTRGGLDSFLDERAFPAD